MDYYRCNRCNSEFLGEAEERGCSCGGTERKEIQCPACGNADVTRTSKAGFGHSRPWWDRPIRFG